MDARNSPLLVFLGALIACAPQPRIPDDALRLPESTLDIRSIQTRTFAARSETEILAATVALLQDMDFNVDRVEKPLGVITASKVSDADDFSQKTGLFMLDLLCVLSMTGGCNSLSTAHDEQRITLTMVVLPSLAKSVEFVARITLQRAIFYKQHRVVVLERIDNAVTYQQIFENLSKAIFIEVNDNA